MHVKKYFFAKNIKRMDQIFYSTFKMITEVADIEVCFYNTGFIFTVTVLAINVNVVETYENKKKLHTKSSLVPTMPLLK